MPKIIVGLSGGVDSSVTAYLLKEKGYEIEGISLLMHEDNNASPAACCSCRAKEDISQTASHIGIPYRIIDVRDDFTEKVIKPFINAYLSGCTPNPCVLCNRFIKFPCLIKEAEEKGAEYIATGHYARVEPAESKGQRTEGKNNPEHFLLKKGVDPNKDQSYVLYALRQQELRRLILPLGNCKKNEIRKTARGLNLPSAERTESQEICFIEDKNYFKFIEKYSPGKGNAGPIVDLHGKVIGTHRGVYRYTIGQRKGMGISSAEPLYVIKIDVLQNTIYAGPREAAQKQEFYVEDINWIIPMSSPSVREDNDGSKFRASVRVRSTMQDQPATIHLETSPPSPKKLVKVVFDEPQWAPAPGQSAVFYDDDRVIGGGVIKKQV